MQWTKVRINHGSVDTDLSIQETHAQNMDKRVYVQRFMYKASDLSILELVQIHQNAFKTDTFLKLYHIIATRQMMIIVVHKIFFFQVRLIFGFNMLNASVAIFPHLQQNSKPKECVSMSMSGSVANWQIRKSNKKKKKKKKRKTKKEEYKLTLLLFCFI